ncbi:MAG: hypothetical protein HC848_04215 [Limnobacter sp.]|nr:hypothetical protein [Limnobacter sp.]
MTLSITPEQLQTVKSHIATGNYKEGWKYLASIGDQYADNAYAVTSGNSLSDDPFLRAYDKIMHRLVQNYWENVAGPNAYEEKFDAVGFQHFSQYVTLIDQSGTLPNSQQIEASYREAVTDKELPPNTAVDGAITQSFGAIFNALWPGEKNEGLDWTDFLGMEDERQVPSSVYSDLDPLGSLSNILNSVDFAHFIETSILAVGELLEASGYNLFTPPVEIQTPTPIPGSPLVLDLDGDGLETIGLDSNIHFDHNGDGFAETTGWVGADDALLAFKNSSHRPMEYAS